MKNKFYYKLITLLLILPLFTSCVKQANVIKNNQSINANNGVLLVSITKDQEESNYFLKKKSSAWFYYKKIGDKDDIRLDSHEFSLLAQHDDFSTDSSQSGQLLAVSLEAGTYEITRWTLYVTNNMGYKYISPENPIPHKFNINAGEILYIGNLHLSTLYGKNAFGISIEAGTKPNVQDKNERDYILAKEKYPQLSTMPFKKEIASLNEQ